MPKKKRSRAGSARPTAPPRKRSRRPTEVAADARPVRSRAKPKRPRARVRTVLIIDSDRASALQARKHLVPEGYEVVVVKDAHQGLRLAQEGQVSLVLVDIALAEMDGFQVCKSMTTDVRTCHIPVVFLTQRTEPADRLLGFLAGGSDYITKPFTRDTIVQGVNKLLRGGDKS